MAEIRHLLAKCEFVMPANAGIQVHWRRIIKETGFRFAPE